MSEETFKEIWLQCYDEDGNYIDTREHEVTWCQDQMEENDVKYVRSDIVNELQEELSRYVKLYAAAIQGRIDMRDGLRKWRQEAMKSLWVPASESPEEQGDYWVSLKAKEGSRLIHQVGFWNKNGWAQDGKAWHVIAWMPIPEYKSELHTEIEE